MNPRGTQAAALILAAVAALVIADALVVRRLGGGVQATALLCQWLVASAAVPLVGLAVSTRAVASRRLAGGRGSAGGSAIKVAATAALGLGFLGAMLAFAVPFSRVVALFPEPTTGAVYIYRLGLALPALGVGLTAAAGLLVVDGAAVVLPAMVVGSAAQLLMAMIWHGRFRGLPGFELAGPGLAAPLGALVAGVTIGVLLVGSAMARERLAVHTGRPFAVADMGPLVVGSLPAMGWGAVIVVGAVAWQIAVLRGGGSPAVSGAVSTAGTAALCLALGLELLHRSRSWRAALGLSILMLAGAIAALAVPDRLARGLVDLAVLAGRDVWSVRLIGVGLVQEVLLALAAWRGWLRPRPSWITELAVCGAVSVVLLAGLVLLGEVQVTSAVLVVVLARGVVTPLLRRS